MIKTRINNEYKDIIKIFGGGTLQKEIIKVWSREAQEYVYESSVEYTGSLPITINANGDALIDYRIYGTDGGVGEKTENLFDVNRQPSNTWTALPYGYKLPMTVSDGNTVQSVPVYIGENKLDSVEGVADYIDKANGKIVRMIGEYTFTGNENFSIYGNRGACYTVTDISPAAESPGETITMRCDHSAFTAIINKGLGYWASSATIVDNACSFRIDRSQVVFRSTSNFMTAEECKAYFKGQYDNGTPVKISYWLQTPIEEDPPVPFPEIPTIDGETVIDYDGDPKPSQMYIKYRR